MMLRRRRNCDVRNSSHGLKTETLLVFRARELTPITTVGIALRVRINGRG